MPAPRTPAVTVDVVVELRDRPDRPVVLVRRRNPPPGWALPGGFVDLGETLEQAAVREAREETGLEVRLEALLGCYSDPLRDARGHTVSAVYVGSATGDPVAADDAALAESFAIDRLPSELAFDHGLILQDYRVYRETGRPAPLRSVGLAGKPRAEIIPTP